MLDIEVNLESGSSVNNYNLAQQQFTNGYHHIAYEYIVRAIANLRKAGIDDTNMINIDYFQLKGDILCKLSREDEAEMYWRKCRELINKNN